MKVTNHVIRDYNYHSPRYYETASIYPYDLAPVNTLGTWGYFTNPDLTTEYTSLTLYVN